MISAVKLSKLYGMIRILSGKVIRCLPGGEYIASEKDMNAVKLEL